LQAKIYDLIDTQTILVSLRGLGIMKGTAEAIRVLHSRVEWLNDDRLSLLIDFVQEEFVKHGFLSQVEEPLLHATLVNVKYVRWSGSRSPSPASTNNSKDSSAVAAFDGTSFLQKYADYNFGIQRLGSLELCKMTESDENGYKSEAVVSLP
jgi:hypothetical protein